MWRIIDAEPMDRIITLLTDFGHIDPYVGIMKGVIAGIAPSARVIDLTHGIPPQDVETASHCLASACPYFPPGTIHLAVVDPGVGTSRKAVAIELETGFLVGPDNGLFTGVLEHAAMVGTVALDDPAWWLTRHPNSTFHGRDIFAPVAAHLAIGVSLRDLGTALDPETLVRLPEPLCERKEGVITGCVHRADGFGNLLTNVDGRLLEGRCWSVQAGGTEIRGCETYADAPPGSLLALVGSDGFVEISVNGGSARSTLHLGARAPVKVFLRASRTTGS